MVGERGVVVLKKLSLQGEDPKVHTRKCDDRPGHVISPNDMRCS